VPCADSPGGRNGVGKSTYLRGLELFYEPTPKITAEDFYAEDLSAPIAVAVSFTNLGPEARTLFAAYLQGDDLTVDRVFTLVDGKITWKYHGASLQCANFAEIRKSLAVKDRGKSARAAYDAVRTTARFSDLPAWSNLGDVEPSLKAWEAAHPGDCRRQRDDGQFFGFREVGQGYLGRFTRLLLIPAVRDAGVDSPDTRGSIFGALLDLVVRSVLANRDEVTRLKGDMQARYREIVDPARLPELGTLAGSMTATLKTFVPDAGVELKWRTVGDIDLPMPQAELKLVEDGYESTVSRVGHGLQRAFIVTMLQHLAAAQGTMARAPAGPQAVASPTPPDLVFVIEEPELYQHPNRQRHLARILRELTSTATPGVAEKTQVIYATHSPLFVGIDRIDQVRVLRKVANGNRDDGTPLPKRTTVTQTTLDDVAREIWTACGAKPPEYTGATLLPRLHALMTPWMSEGFFADVAVLVEGEDDRAAILGTAAAMGVDLESAGCAVIPCGGKTSLDRPAAIFRQLGIATYVVWDSDFGSGEAKPEDNHTLLRLLGLPTEDWPDMVTASCASFRTKLENVLQAEIGENDFEALLTRAQETFNIPQRRHAVKNPAVIAEIVRVAAAEGRRSATIEAVVTRIRESAQSANVMRGGRE
jgi:putative ATP-dependent endonuclease of OLD family